MKLSTACGILLLAFLSGCTTPVEVSKKPDIQFVAKSNKAIQVSAKKIHDYSNHELKLNQDIQTNLDAGLNALDKILAQ